MLHVCYLSSHCCPCLNSCFIPALFCRLCGRLPCVLFPVWTPSLCLVSCVDVFPVSCFLCGRLPCVLSPVWTSSMCSVSCVDVFPVSCLLCGRLPCVLSPVWTSSLCLVSCVDVCPVLCLLCMYVCTHVCMCIFVVVGIQQW